MDLIFLQTSVPLTKTYEKKGSEIVKTPYPNVYEVTSIEEKCPDLKTFEQLLIKHAAAKNCLLKGSIARPLVKESRAGSTDTNGFTDWICLDIDGLPNVTTVDINGTAHSATVSLDDLLAELGLADISYVLQWSASYGISNTDYRCHLFMQLDKAYPAPLLKQWLIHRNHESSLLNSSMRLTRTGNSISWTLDITACQNDKLIYIAPPILKGGLKDPLAKRPRITYVKKKHDKLSITEQIPTTAKNRERTLKRIEELREAEGLPKRKITFKMHGSTEIMVKPDECTITDMKVERGFVYFNLNGGDSWAYYHPENNPNYIYNFKGEPTYLTKELIPSYWAEISSSATHENSEGKIFLALCDKRGSYWRGIYDRNADSLDLFPAKNETQVRDFAKENGWPLGDYVPTWDVIFDPTGKVPKIDVDHRTLNTFTPSVYMSNADKTKGRKIKTPPPLITKIITNALGDDQECVDHFLNWLAFIFQRRELTGTCWVLHGIQGTGKGSLLKLILRPLFGSKQVAARNMEDLGERFNDYIANALIVFIDEIQTTALVNENSVLAKMRNYVTESPVPVRAMHRGSVELPNYSNWIMSSNKSDPVKIPRDDRRTNVARFQPNKLVMSQAERDAVETELQDFANFLAAFDVDEDKVRTPIDNTDRTILMDLSETSTDSVANALLNGDAEFFIDQMPTNERFTNQVAFNRTEEYKVTLTSLLQRTDLKTGKCNIARDELRSLFEYCVGNVPDTPNKFTTYLKHHRIYTTRVWVDKTVHGITVTWKNPKAIPALLKQLLPTSKPPMKRVK